MKKLIGIFFLLFCSYCNAQDYFAPDLKCDDQQKVNDFFNTEAITWFGIDFSQTKLIHEIYFSDIERIRDFYYNEINRVILAEADKYKLDKYFKKDLVSNDLSIVKKRNLLPDIKYLTQEEDCFFSETQIKNVVYEYKNSDNANKYGAILLIEKMFRAQDNCYSSMVLCFFEIKTGKIIFYQYFMEPCSGYGFRNEWLGAIYSALKKFSMREAKSIMYKKDK